MHKAPVPKVLMGLLIILTIIIFLLGLSIINKQKQRLLSDRQIELASVAEMKADQVSKWRKDRIIDGQLIQENTFLIDLVQSCFSEKDNQYQKEVLTKWMNSLITHYDYRSIVLLDKNWEPLISLPGSESNEGATRKYGKERLLQEHKVVLTNLHKVENPDYSHFDLLVPLFKSQPGHDSIFVGLFLLRIDPSVILYPILERWPIDSADGETFLVNIEGDSLSYISRLKYENGAISINRAPAKEIKQNSSPAPYYHKELLHITDFSNNIVPASYKTVPETGWTVIVIADINDILISSKKERTLTKIIIALVLVSFLSLALFLIWFHLVRFYKKIYKVETEKKALIKHFDYILKFANDMIFLFDNDLKIIEVNDKVVETYGYKLKELLRMKAADLRTAATAPEIYEQYRELRSNKSLTFNTVHKKKNGQEMPLEVSARVVEIDGETYFQNICRDITERKLQEQKANDLLQKYNLALNAAEMGVWDLEFNNWKLTWDDTVSRVYGKNKDKITNSVNEWYDVVHPDDLERAKAVAIDAINELKDYNSEYRIIMPDGTVKYIKSTGKLVMDSDNKPLRITGVTRDITDQKRAFNLLSERDFWLTESQRVGQVGSFSIDIGANRWKTSEVLDDILGLQKETPKTIQTWKDMVHPDFSEEMENYFKDEYTKRQALFNKEFKIIKQDTGEVKWILGRGEFTWGDEPLPISLIGVFHDITERKNAEEELRQSNTKINTLINNLKGVIFKCTFEEALTMKYISDGIYELTGYEPDDFIDNKVRSFNSVIFTPDRYRVWDQIRDGIKKFSSYTIEYRIVTSTGVQKWVWEHGRGSSFGQDIDYIEGFITDITDRKLVEEELLRAKEKAEESDRLKTAFLHNISHEIRTPMNAIVGFTTLLDTPEMNEETRRQYMDIVFNSSNQLLSIINDIVDISNIEIGHVKLSPGSVNINNLLKNLYDQFSLRAVQQGLKFSFRNTLDDDASFIKTDETKLTQVLTNLLSNAMKFTPTGSIEFGYALRDNDIEFFVKDTGIGIEESNYDKVFNRFYQIENALSRQFPGTGLGLSISKAYVDLMEGRIWLSSAPGKGSTFYFTIPYDSIRQQPVSPSVETAKSVVSSNSKTILVAEDDRTNFLLIREIISKSGVNVIWASNGEEAVNLCRKSQTIDVILMDIKMPVMDGYEATKIIKEFRPALPIIALTAYAQDSDKEKALAAGFVAHISKPVDRSLLFSVLQKYL